MTYRLETGSPGTENTEGRRAWYSAQGEAGDTDLDRLGGGSALAPRRPSSNVLVIQNQATEPLGPLTPPLRDLNIQGTVWRAWLGEDPPELGRFTGVISLGGAANPLEQARYPWLAREQELIRRALHERVPLLGVCLGAELIAHVIDGSTRRLTQPEIGWLAIAATNEAMEDQLWCELPERTYGFEWHGYGFANPVGAVPLAVGGASLQAFRFGPHVWGVQFHIDADEKTIADWIELYERELVEAEVDPTELARSTARHVGESKRLAYLLGHAFGVVVNQRADEMAEIIQPDAIQ